MSAPRFLHALMIGAAVAVMAAAVWFVGHAQRDAASRSFEQTEQVQAMLAAMLDQETGLRGYLLNRRREFMTPYVDGERDFRRALASARRVGGHGVGVDRLLDRSDEIAREWRTAADTRLRLGGRVPLVEAERRKALMDQFRVVNRRLRDTLHERRAEVLSRATSVAVALIVLLSMLFGGLGWLIVGRPLARQRRRDERRAVLRERQTAFARALQMSDSEEDTHALVKRHLERTVDGAGVTVLYRDASGARLRATTPVKAESPLADALAYAEPRSCLAVRLGGAHEEGGDAPDLLQCGLCGKSGRDRSLCSPLLVSGEVIGSVLVAHDDALGEDEREQVADAVTQAAPVIANLRNLAVAELRAATDPLTGLANRRALNDTIKRMLAQAARTGGSLSAIALDLDHFKQINDRHGHDRGDEVLAAAGAALTATLRVSDFVARAGGEEFVVLLPDTGLDGAVVVAENLRAALQALAVPGLDGPVTGSFGVAVYPEDAPDADELLRRADRALYAAKANGRNRVEAAASPA
jgi:diguanylate cyclase (GGDEF)-like protein